MRNTEMPGRGVPRPPGGYYDRLLPFVSATASRVAGAFDMQIVDVVPTAAHDIGVDVVVTEQRTLYCGNRCG